MLKKIITIAGVFILTGTVAAAWLEGTQPLASRPLTPPVATVEISDDAVTTAKINPSGGSAGDILTVTAGPDVQWAAPAAAPDADWTISGSNMYSAVSGNVGVGITAPVEKFEVVTTANQRAGSFKIDNATSTYAALRGETNGISSAVYGVATGNGRAGHFLINNAASNQNALRGETNGTGNAVSGYNNGSAGYGGFFEASNSAAGALRAEINTSNWTAYFYNSSNGRALQVNNILNLVPRSAAPSSPTEGTIYVNSSSHHIFCYLNGTWKQLDN
jgi:hypothetical protein